MPHYQNYLVVFLLQKKNKEENKVIDGRCSKADLLSEFRKTVWRFTLNYPVNEKANLDLFYSAHTETKQFIRLKIPNSFSKSASLSTTENGTHSKKGIQISLTSEGEQ